jgi:hypothetical protein
MAHQKFVLSDLICARRMRLFDELRSVIVAKTSQRAANGIDLTALLFAPEVFALGNGSNMRVHVEGPGDLMRCYGREH